MFNRCENTNGVLLAVPGWANVHPLLKVIPMEMDLVGLIQADRQNIHGEWLLCLEKKCKGELYDV